MDLFPKQVGDRYPTSRYSIVVSQLRFLELKCVCGRRCGQTGFQKTLCVEKTQCLSQSLADQSRKRGEYPLAPKSSALPGELHLEILSYFTICGRRCGQMIFFQIILN